MPAQSSLTSFNPVNQPTMSSREIADLVESRHDNVKRTIERCVEKGVFTFPPTEETSFTGSDGRKQTVTTYQLDKRSSLIVVAQLSPEFTAKVIDRWIELEQGAQPTPRLAHITVDQLMGSATVSSIELSRVTGATHEVVLAHARHLRSLGVITGDSAVEHSRTHPSGGYTYCEFVFGLADAMEVASGFGPKARRALISHWREMDLDVDTTAEHAGALRLTYEHRLALPDARQLEQDALNTLKNTYKVCRSVGYAQDKARAIAVKDTRQRHGVDYSPLLDETT